MMDKSWAPFDDKKFEDMLAQMKETGPEWQLMEDGEVKVWRKPDAKNKALMMMRASMVVPAEKALDPVDVMHVWRDIEYRWTWDDRCAANTVHCKIAEGTPEENEIGYYQGKAPAPLSDRDWVLQSGWRYEFQGRPEWIYMNTSVECAELGEKKGIVRAISYVTGIHIVKGTDGSVIITYLTNGDVGGWIPKAVVNWIMTKAAPSLMTQMLTSALGYKKWRAEQDAKKAAAATPQ